MDDMRHLRLCTFSVAMRIAICGYHARKGVGERYDVVSQMDCHCLRLSGCWSSSFSLDEQLGRRKVQDSTNWHAR